jgi:L-threonylcarbamoyladenylate synthase
LNKHYSPKTQTILTTDITSEIEKHPNKKIGVLTFNTFYRSDKIDTQIILSEEKNLQEAASKLYDSLHQLDSLNLDVIIVEEMPNFGLGKSMNDRLQRASFID